MRYVYAITRVPARVDAPGVTGAGVVDLPWGDLNALVSRVSEAPPAEPAVMLAHAAVVDQALGRGAVLPVRFGTVVTSDGALREQLDEHRQAYLEALGLVDGCVELIVRARWPAEHARDGGGREYLDALRAEHDRAGALHTLLSAGTRRSIMRADGGRFTGAYLLMADRADAFTRRLTQMRAADPALDCSCTGPWPPYSFVNTP
jgi:Gas vesicle synthesis protein GvpL/GvpF